MIDLSLRGASLLWRCCGGNLSAVSAPTLLNAAGLCTDALQGEKVLMPPRVSQCKTTQQAFLPTVTSLGDAIPKKSINPK